MQQLDNSVCDARIQRPIFARGKFNISILQSQGLKLTLCKQPSTRNIKLRCLKSTDSLVQFWMKEAKRCHFWTSWAETDKQPTRTTTSAVPRFPPSEIFVRISPAHKQLSLWCWQLDTNLLPVWIQKGILPSVWDRCGPLKLYLYSNRRWGGSSDVEAPAAISATLQWNINVVRKVNINTRAVAARRWAVDTAMFRYHCWRSAQSTSMTGCL